MSSQIRPNSGYASSNLISTDVSVNSSKAQLNSTESPSHFSASVHPDISQLSEKLQQVDFDSPAKIFQNKHAIHQFENLTPHTPATPLPQPSPKFGYESDITGADTPRSISPKNRQSPPPTSSPSESTSRATSRPVSQIDISRTATPSQFVFKKPEYNSHYHSTHFHHLEKKDTIFHDFKKLFKNKKKKKLLDDQSSVRSGASSVYSKQSDLSFANEFNKNIEGRYGKWGKVYILCRYHGYIYVVF